MGSQTNFYEIHGLREHAFTLEAMTAAHHIHDHIDSLCAQASSEPDEAQRKKLLRFIVDDGLSRVKFAAEFAEHAVHKYLRVCR